VRKREEGESGCLVSESREVRAGKSDAGRRRC
jgi:hypothetical protein